MSVAEHTDKALVALEAAPRIRSGETKEIRVATAQVHALLAVAAAIQELAEATRRE